MKTEARIFLIIAVFCFVSTVVYAAWAKEVVGIVGISLTGGLCFIIGTYFWFVSRRVEQRPEDNPEAEISDGAGELGFFSPGSYWPFTLAVGAALAGVSLAFFYPWLIAIAVGCILLSVGGLVFEYHTGPNHE
jgi:Cytochrome c oxidase subunit IV